MCKAETNKPACGGRQGRGQDAEEQTRTLSAPNSLRVHSIQVPQLGAHTGRVQDAPALSRTELRASRSRGGAAGPPGQGLCPPPPPQGR